MLRIAVPAVLIATSLALAGPAGPSGAAPEATAPTHTLTVSGTGVGMYPSYDSSVRRYAATTTQASFPSNTTDKVANQGATVTVNAATSDPAGSVLVDGVPVVSGQVTLAGVDAGDEISVIFVDSVGREADAVYVLPADFPTLTATIKQPGITPGLVALTLFEFQDTSMPRFATFVDANGVPAWTRASMSNELDLKRQPNGSYSVAEPVPGTPPANPPTYQIVELDAQFHQVATHVSVGLANTDNHDSILEADGSKVFVSYEVNGNTGRTDSVIQEVDGAGVVTFQWDSSSLADETVTPHQLGTDYAHINSVQIVNGGQDFLASFRGLSAVLLIARHAHDGFQPGDIVWKLGGRASSFTFVDDPYAGPCAQHTASQLPNGDVMIFDDGSVAVLGDGPNCVDQADPTGALVARPVSRVTVYHLDTTDHTATLVRSYSPDDSSTPPPWFSWFMGSAQYLPSTHNLVVGWAAETRAVAEEVAEDNTTLWRLVATKTAANNQTYISYRAQKYDVPDALRPAVSVTVPAEGATYAYGEQVPTDFSCTDTGGSTLQTCGDSVPGALLDTTTPGDHTFRVKAADGAGNTRTVARHYTVGPIAYRPDMVVRRPDGSWIGTRVYGPVSDQTVTWRLGRGASASIGFQIANRGQAPDRCVVRGSLGSSSVRATYRFDGRDVSQAVADGTWRPPSTAPGERALLHLELRIGRRVAHGWSRTFSVRCTASPGHPADTAAAHVVVR